MLSPTTTMRSKWDASQAKANVSTNRAAAISNGRRCAAFAQ
jgi:hypothetical protein